eukprot:15345392-Ditylum_brightwellii.AAC.1
MTGISDVNHSLGNVHNDDSYDESLIDFFENKASKYNIDEDSDFSDDSSTCSDDGCDAGHTTLNKKSRHSQEKYIPDAGDILVKKAENVKHA